MNILKNGHGKDNEFPNPPIKKKQSTKKNNNIRRNPSSANKMNSICDKKNNRNIQKNNGI